ncbi:MAG: polysaccharide deacetylase family protein [Bacteroidaceae bacterium]|nr:polysaccharide deacetylase family protein [Bacteroidaceae bacterium]
MVALSFDTEEFDVPREHGVQWNTLDEGMDVSRQGTNRILDCLKECGVKGTFFCTTNFAKHAPEVIERIIAEGHEVAAHGCDHWEPKPSDLENSKHLLEQQTGLTIKGYRQPRMFPLSIQELKKNGYVYNASLNPCFIPGRYMHLSTPRTCFVEDGIIQIPASVSPLFRIPMFWLALHNFPLWYYKNLARRILHHDGYFNTYFHPWEFFPLGNHPEMKMPYIIRHNAGDGMYNRLRDVIIDLKRHGARFVTYSELASAYVANKIGK